MSVDTRSLEEITLVRMRAGVLAGQDDLRDRLDKRDAARLKRLQLCLDFGQAKKVVTALRAAEDLSHGKITTHLVVKKGAGTPGYAEAYLTPSGNQPIEGFATTSDIRRTINGSVMILRLNQNMISIREVSTSSDPAKFESVRADDLAERIGKWAGAHRLVPRQG